MAMKGIVRNFKPLEILTEEQVEAIHRATLDILWETGVIMQHKKALKLLEKNGCRVDYNEMSVRFEPGLVEECLRKTPSSFHVKARHPKHDLVIGGNVTYCQAFSANQAVDLDTWEPRAATRKENYDAVTVMDALENLHIISPYCPYFDVEDVPPVMSISESTAAHLRNSTKVQMTGYSLDSEIFDIQMAQAVGIEVIGDCLASPPLTYYSEAIESLFRYVEAGLPCWIASGNIHGGTAPATIAGATITNNAELMAGVVLAQVLKPGARIAVGDYTFPQNMRSGAPAFGAIGVALHQVVFNQIWRKYGIAIGAGASGCSNSKRIDFQNGYEKAMLALTFVLSGASTLSLHGGVSSELTFHPIQAILDEDIAGMIGRFMDGVEVNDETLALDLIKQVGPIPGSYLSTKHTRDWWKREQFVPKVADWLTYPEWMESDKKSALDYAKERMEEILTTHKPVPLTANQEEDIERLLEEEREYYRGKGLM